MSMPQRELLQFLNAPGASVFCLRGKWGTGKTYLWDQCLSEAIKAKTVSLRRSSYVSLFGIDSLRDLKTAILENTISNDTVGNTPSVASVSRLLKDFDEPESRRALAGLGAHMARRSLTGLATAKLPWVSSLADAAAPAAFLIVRDQIICIDDLERRGKNLSLSDVMGLASFLKERRSCKILIIANEDQLGDKREEFDTHAEKVCDISLLYEPTPVEACDIALMDSQIIEPISSVTQKLEITNVRVIRRIAEFAQKLSQILEGYDRRTNVGALESLAVLGWTTFMTREAPNAEFLAEKATLSARVISSMGKEPIKDTPQEERWMQLLDEVGWSEFTALDAEILASLRRGYFIPKKIFEIVGPMEESQRQADERQKFHDAWRLYHDHLTDNSKELISAFDDAVRSGSKYISLSNFGACVRIVKALGETQLAKHMIDFYFRAYADDPEFFQPNTRDPSHITDEPEVMAAFSARYTEKVDERDLGEVLDEIADRRWSSENLKRIESASVKDLQSAIHALPQNKVTTRLRDLAAIKDVGDPNILTTWKKIREALKAIANESVLNGLRLRHLDLGSD